jgi:hypothetical protein
MDEPEKGIKWWLRYVIVPILGTGGIVAVVVAVLSRPPSTKPADTRKIAESADLWATSGKTEERRYGHIMIGKKEEILIHWDVPEPNGKVKLVLTNPFLSQRHEWDVTGYIQTKTPNVEMSFHGYEAQGEFTIEDNGVRVGSPLDVDIKDE